MGLLSLFKQLFSGKKGAGNIVNVQNRFQLLGRTGQGSMSKVWRANDRNLGRVVCLKLLDAEKTEKFEARFIGVNKPKEGAICVSLRHPNIVQTYEYGMTTEGEPYLVMELVDGMGLNFLIETKSPQMQGNRIDIMHQMAEALAYLHAQGYLHRDICPRNVMVTKDGVVKMIDFGLAIPNTPEFCKPGNRTGTPNYLAPEIIRRISTDLRVDLFALGVTAYEVFTGNLPWEKAQSMQTLLSHMNSPGRDPRDYIPRMDEATAKFLMKAVERDPGARFQTPKQFQDAMKRLPKQ